jgi:hypothetical protein
MLKPRFDPFRFTRPLTPTQDERRALIADMAYKRAQRRGFEPGHELEDWLAAEAEVDFDLSLRYVQSYAA